MRVAWLGIVAFTLAGVALPLRAQDQGAAALDAPVAPPAPEAAPPTVFAPAPALAPAAPVPPLPAFEEPESLAPAAESPPPAAQPLPPVAPEPPAQPPVAPRPQLEPWPNTLDERTRLSCPECACVRARNDYALLRHEYRGLQRKVSTKRPRMLMLAGFIGAGAFTVITAMAYTQPYSEDPAERENPARRRRVLAQGAVAISIPLGVGLAGMHWFRERRRDGAPYRARHRELKYELRESKEYAREACRAAPRS
jgi:hypothetical protein